MVWSVVKFASLILFHKGALLLDVLEVYVLTMVSTELSERWRVMY